MLRNKGLPESDMVISIVVAARLNWRHITCPVLFQGFSADHLISHSSPVLEALTLFDRCSPDSLRNLSVSHSVCRNPGLPPQYYSGTMYILKGKSTNGIQLHQYVHLNAYTNRC